MFRQSVSEILGGGRNPPPRLWDGSKKPGSFRVKKKKKEEMKEKTKHHKHNISAGFHPGKDNKQTDQKQSF